MVALFWCAVAAALSQDMSTPYVYDSGPLPPSSGTSVIEAVLQAQTTVRSASPVVEAPTSWGTSWSQSGYAMGYRKGFSPVLHLIGLGSGGTNSTTYADPGPDVTALLAINGTTNGVGTACEESVRNADPDTTRIVLERGIGTLTPGASECSTTTPIVARSVQWRYVHK